MWVLPPVIDCYLSDGLCFGEVATLEAAIMLRFAIGEVFATSFAIIDFVFSVWKSRNVHLEHDKVWQFKEREQ